ncbi:carbon-nitrogen hydrolase [Sordaria brevicollis]|uniref:Carbon-nitrogen hydrolase n=1 Tax=Sordaria brevicollis TaxID=83679 RepID=A0AAE0PFU5_SORBR|nr:carbon-nitrogen hydrolase [Sordaria brevicollis]
MASSSTKIKLAAAHSAPVFMNKRATLAKAIDLIHSAARDGVSLLVFPETYVPGYPYFIECYPTLKQVSALAKYAEESVVVDEDLDGVVEACRQTGVSVVLGVSERMKGGYTCFNSQVFVKGGKGGGGVVGTHRKLQPTYVERIVWGQGDGSTLRTWGGLLPGGDEGKESKKWNVGGLACWEHTMLLARQALITQQEHVHAAAWPALSTMAGFEGSADSQIEALMKCHALTAQCFVVAASNYVDETCLEWMRENIGEQEFVKRGGGWSAVIHPFCNVLAGPATGEKEELVIAEVDLKDLGMVKVWVDADGHYSRPEILGSGWDKEAYWRDMKEKGQPQVKVTDGKGGEEVKKA